MSVRKENRINSYKNTSRTEIEKKKRVEGIIQLRKDARDDQLQKRRNICVDIEDHFIENKTPEKINQDEVKSIIEGIFKVNHPHEQLVATKQARKMLSKQINPPIYLFKDKQILSQLVSFLSWKDNHEMLFEASWTLTNIASGSSDDTAAVYESNAIPALINLLDPSITHVAEQAMWALGNISGDCAKFRDAVLDQGILENLCELANYAIQNVSNEASLVRNLAWTVANLCRSRQRPTKMDYIRRLLPLIIALIQQNDAQVLIDMSWSLSYLTEGPNDRIQIVIDNNIHIKMIEMLYLTEDTNLATPILRMLGNIVTGSDVQTQVIIDANILPCLSKWITSSNNSIVKDVVWTISNILAGTSVQIDAVLQASLLPPVISLLSKGDFKTRKEACWAISNLSSSGTIYHKKYLIEGKGVEGLCSLLKVLDQSILKVCLTALENLLAEDQIKEETIDQIEECGGLDDLEALQQSDQQIIYQMAYDLLTNYFTPEDEVTADNQMFSFEPPKTNQHFNF